MKRKLYLFCIISALPILLLAQADSLRITIVPGSIEIRPAFKASGDTNYVINLQVFFKGDYDTVTAANNVLKLQFDENLPLSILPAVVNNATTITKAQWNTGKKFAVTLLVHAFALDTVISQDEIGHIVIADHPESYYTIRLKAGNPVNTDADAQDPYWVEMGTNIDLVDGAKANNFTAGIFFQKFDNSWGNRSNNKWTWFAGAYEAKIVSSVRSKFNIFNIVNDQSFIPGRSDTIKVYKYGGKPKQTQTIRNWSFFASPAYKMTSGAYDNEKFHWFIAPWIELRYQEVETKTDNNALHLVDSSYDDVKNIATYNTAADTIINSGIYAHYWGVGFPVYYAYNHRKVTLFLNPVLGISNQPTADLYGQLAKGEEIRKSRRWKPFYCVQFRLTAYLGITVTGEIRGLIKKDNPPQYTIALTKKFNLQKLLSYN